MNLGKYLYGFIKESERKEVGLSQLSGTNIKVYTINVGEVSAIVSDVKKLEFDPTRKNTLAHQRVLLKVMNNYSVVPVAFGMVANNQKDIEWMIESYYDELLEHLDRLEGKIEIGLKVTWSNHYFDHDIQTEEIKELKQYIHGKSEKEVFSEKITLGKLVEASIENKRESYIEEIFETLEIDAVESKLKEHNPIRTVFNAYFLINKEDEELFDQKVEELALLYEGKLVFNYTGPWPPYNFINMNISIEDIN